MSGTKTASSPEPGEGATLSRWLVADGDIVEQGEPICELETKLATVDLPAWKKGVLKQLSRVGDGVTTTTELGRIS